MAVREAGAARVAAYTPANSAGSLAIFNRGGANAAADMWHRVLVVRGAIAPAGRCDADGRAVIQEPRVRDKPVGTRSRLAGAGL